MPRIAATGEWPKNCKISAGLRTEIMRHARGLARACIMNNYDNEAGLAYWKAVDIEIAKEWKNERRKTDQKN